ncbi:MAG: hypothetical protein J4F41_00020 [Alphaproteobacteria bacterium]|nr:hypothetical protein [Alphaproteobacteria bacterium]
MLDLGLTLFPTVNGAASAPVQTRTFYVPSTNAWFQIPAVANVGDNQATRDAQDTFSRWMKIPFRRPVPSAPSNQFRGQWYFLNSGTTNSGNTGPALNNGSACAYSETSFQASLAEIIERSEVRISPLAAGLTSLAFETVIFGSSATWGNSNNYVAIDRLDEDGDPDVENDWTEFDQIYGTLYSASEFANDDLILSDGSTRTVVAAGGWWREEFEVPVQSRLRVNATSGSTHQYDWAMRRMRTFGAALNPLVWSDASYGDTTNLTLIGTPTVHLMNFGGGVGTQTVGSDSISLTRPAAQYFPADYAVGREIIVERLPGPMQIGTITAIDSTGFNDVLTITGIDLQTAYDAWIADGGIIGQSIADAGIVVAADGNPRLTFNGDAPVGWVETQTEADTHFVTITYDSAGNAISATPLTPVPPLSGEGAGGAGGAVDPVEYVPILDVDGVAHVPTLITRGIRNVPTLAI